MNKKDALKVLIVDDSQIWRSFVKVIVEDHPEFEVVGTAENGLEATETIKNQYVDIVLLDIQMDIMDGITALPAILEINPSVKILIVSNLSAPEANITLEALALGAADFLPKPSLTLRTVKNKPFPEELIDKLLSFKQIIFQEKKHDIRLRPLTPHPSPFKMLGLGASTGGPKALVEFLQNLSPKFSFPILIAQHMPPVFTKAFAQLIQSKTHRFCIEAEDGMEIEQKKIYVAPGDHHLTINSKGNKFFILLTQDEPVNYSRPSVDVLFESLSQNLKSQALAIVFTGLGNDGTEGSRKLVESGSKIFVQDEQSSLVWGMPGSIVGKGLASQVLDIKDLAKATEKEFSI